MEPASRALTKPYILASLCLVFSHPDSCHLAYTPSFRRYSWLQRSPCPYSPRPASVSSSWGLLSMGQSVSCSVYPNLRSSCSCPLGVWRELRYRLGRVTYVYAEAWKNCAKLKSRRKVEGVVTRDQPFPITMFWLKTLRISEPQMQSWPFRLFMQCIGPGRRIMLIFPYKSIARFETLVFTYN